MMQTRRDNNPPIMSACSGSGVFVGYASLFGKRDAAGDIVMPGAFAKSLMKRPSTDVRMLFQHDPAEPVGTWLEMTETPRGLYVRGRLNMHVQRGRELTALLERKGLDGLSIGYKTIKARQDKATKSRQLFEVDLWEISLVTFPMLAGARVHEMKRKSWVDANRYFENIAH